MRIALLLLCLTDCRRGPCPSGTEVRIEEARLGYRVGCVDKHKPEVRSGPWAWYTSEHTLSCRGAYENGQRQGEWTCWHPSGGQSLDAHFAQGKPHGLWREWDMFGKVVVQGQFSQGQRDGTWTPEKAVLSELPE